MPTITCRHARSIAALVMALFIGGVVRTLGQGVESVGNVYVRASVSTLSESGRFWITAGPALGGYRFLFGNNFISSSNLVFKITSGGTDQYYSNIPFDYPYRPVLASGQEIDFKPYDSIYTSTDTLAVAWKGMNGVSVVMRLIPERVLSPYQNGSDMLLEFSYSVPGSPPGTSLGIFMMLDCYNSQAGGIDGVTTITTSKRHFAIGAPGGLMRSGGDSVPEFYHIGNARFEEPVNTVMGLHRLRGHSHNGVALTTPAMFAVGEWDGMLRERYWDVDSAAVAAVPMGDCATAMRWGSLVGNGTVRTAFGSSDRDGNNYFTCRDSNVFVVMGTARLAEQFEAGGPYVPGSMLCDAWVANLGGDSTLGVTVDLQPPPELIVAGPAMRQLRIAPRAVERVQWTLQVQPASDVPQANLPLGLVMRLDGDSARPFLDVCSPTITLRGIPRPTDDIMAPVVERAGSGSSPTRYWAFRAYDRHAGFAFDTGIDTLRIVGGGTYNMMLTVDTLRRCDTAANAVARAQVIDTTLPARLLLLVRDCRGNTSYDSIIYKPAPRDTMAPVIVHLDSTATRWTIRAGDLHPGYAFDTGIDTVRIVPGKLLNFNLQVGPFVRCDTSQIPVIVARVVDTTLPASIEYVVVDCRGNAIRDSIGYAPLPADVEIGDDARMPLEIVDIRPQPLLLTTNAVVQVRVRGARLHGLTAELIRPDGTVVVRETYPAGTTLLRLQHGADLASGAYLLRVRGASGSVQRMIIAVR